VVSYIFDVMNPFMKVFWLLVEQKFVKMDTHCFFFNVESFLVLQSYLEISFIYVDVYELLKEIGFQPFWCAESISKAFLVGPSSVVVPLVGCCFPLTSWFSPISLLQSCMNQKGVIQSQQYLARPIVLSCRPALSLGPIYASYMYDWCSQSLHVVSVPPVLDLHQGL